MDLTQTFLQGRAMPKNKQDAKYCLTAMINRTSQRQATKVMISRTQSICNSLTSDFICVFLLTQVLKFLPTSEGKWWCSNLEVCWTLFICYLYAYKILKYTYNFYECVYIHTSPHPVWLLPTYTTIVFSINRVYTIPLNSQSCEVLQRRLVAIADYQKWSNATGKKTPTK